jgi:GTP1/Obg family GTP-binding protein
MTDENTADLTTDELLRMILARLDRLEAQAQAQAEERANTTRPLFERAIAEMIQTREALIERLERVEKEIRLFGRKMDIFNEELLELWHGHREVEERVSALEQRPN